MTTNGGNALGVGVCRLLSAPCAPGGHLKRSTTAKALIVAFYHLQTPPRLTESHGCCGPLKAVLCRRCVSQFQPQSQAHLEIMNAHMLPFGVGTRVCGGQNLAQMMLRIAIAALVRNFDVVAPPETNEKSMDIRDSFVCVPDLLWIVLLLIVYFKVIFPAAMQCKLIFVAREK